MKKLVICLGIYAFGMLSALIPSASAQATDQDAIAVAEAVNLLRTVGNKPLQVAEIMIMRGARFAHLDDKVAARLSSGVIPRTRDELISCDLSGNSCTLSGFGGVFEIVGLERRSRNEYHVLIEKTTLTARNRLHYEKFGVSVVRTQNKWRTTDYTLLRQS